MLALQNVSKQYDGQTAVQPTNLAVAGGETCVLLGPSGCGKSTILRMVIGLVPPTTGVIKIGEEEVNPQTVLRLRRRIGYVIQEGGLFPHLSARDNMTLMARHLQWSEERITQRVRSLAGLTHFPVDGLDRYPVQLSGGQRQRVSLMRALFLEPDVLLLDEPLGALDPMIRAELQTELRQIFAQLGLTVMLVTHDLDEAAYFADVITLMKAGRIVQRGSFEELDRSPTEDFVTEFIRAQRGGPNGERESS